jgi:hypothetical protein
MHITAVFDEVTAIRVAAIGWRINITTRKYFLTCGGRALIAGDYQQLLAMNAKVAPSASFGA